MGCIGCAQCLGYNEDGKFGPVYDPDGGVITALDGEMTLATNTPAQTLDPRYLDQEYPNCPNRIHVQHNGEVWADPPITAQEFNFDVTRYLGLNLSGSSAQNTSLTSIGYDNTRCYPAVWLFAITSTIFLSTTSTNFDYRDIVNGSFVQSASFRYQVTSDMDLKKTNSFLVSKTEGAGSSNSLSLGYNIASPDTTSLYSIRHQVRAISFAAPSC